MHAGLRNTNMRLSLCVATIFLVLLISSAIFTMQKESPNQYDGDDDHEDEGGRKRGFWRERENMMEKLGGMKDEKNSFKRGRTLEIAAGSRIPDCSHACGSCSPCILVMVSLTCADAAETCPISYRCMCNSKSYPVP